MAATVQSDDASWRRKRRRNVTLERSVYAVTNLVGLVLWVTSAAAASPFDTNHTWLHTEMHRRDTEVSSSTPIFADTSGNAYYDGYQQAWRMLGIYVDCTGLTSLEPEAQNSHDSQDNSQKSCQRYLMWAAYIDTNYQGNSYGEYQFYDVDTNSWDDSACALTQSPRCAKLDCHVPYTAATAAATSDEADNATAWQLLGIYKERYYASEWFEQLFKHAGYCLWNNYTTYSFMQTYYNVWPENGCVATGQTDAVTGQALYADLAPGPTLRVALYTDAACFAESTMSASSANAILQASGYLSATAQYTFNQHLLQFAVCQPCRAVDWSNTNQNRARRTQQRELSDYSNDPNYPLFACYDDAGYTNVNQCMKFRTHTTLQPATMHDIQTALVQGAIGHVSWGDVVVTSPTSVDSVAARLSLLAAATNLSRAASTVSRVASSSTSATTSWWFLSLASVMVLVAATVLGSVLVTKWNHIRALPQSPKRARRRKEKQRESSYSSRFARRAMLQEPLVQ